jgi:enterochelin esterase family protein
MKKTIALSSLALAFLALAAAAQNPDSQYRLGPDSLPQKGVPRGEIRGPFTLPCKVYPGTQHTYWVYVPAQYDPAVPASLMIFRMARHSKMRTATCARRMSWII